ncbi:MAG: hypothetical protein PEPC_01661 [Peptostreptococcus russellii]
MEYIKGIDECFTLSKVEVEDLYKSVEFSILTNYHNYNQTINPFDLEHDITVSYNKELDFFENAFYYAILAEGDILGTIRVVKWDHTTVLTMEEIYGISVEEILKDYNSNKTIWHIGRFAIDSKTRHNLSSQLLKMLLMYAIEPICQNQNSIALAECDTRLLKIINKLGIRTKTLADSVLYLGSKTVPILSERTDLIQFYNKNIKLLDQQFNTNISYEVQEQS